VTEKNHRGDFKEIYVGLMAISVARLRVMMRSPASYFLNTVSYEFEEIAHMIAEVPFSSRGADKFLKIVDLIIRFFSSEGEKNPEELYKYFRGVTDKNFKQVIKQISSSEKRLHHFINTAVTRHVLSSPRYTRRGDIVTDLEALEASSLRQATIFEIVADCAHLLGDSEKPGRLVDMIFDYILGKRQFSCHLYIKTLQGSVFKLIRSRFTPPAKESTKMDPMQEYIQKETLLLAREALKETAAAYGWREGGSAEFIEAYEKGAWDRLEENIVNGRRMPAHEALGRYIDGLGVNVYESTHKGSFQNFWKVLWENFLKKIRADD
jgi:hypothetical protein